MLTANPTPAGAHPGLRGERPGDLIGAITGVISSKRGKLIKVEQREVVTIIQGEISAAETFPR